MQSVERPPHPGLIGSQTLPSTAVSQAKKIRREVGFPVGWLIAPAAVWLLVFLVVPLVGIIFFSFWTSTGHGMVPDLTLKPYFDYFYSEGFLGSLPNRNSRSKA